MLSILFHVKMTLNILLLTTVNFLSVFYVAGEKCRVSSLCKEKGFGRSRGCPIDAAQPVAPQNCLCSFHLEQTRQQASRCHKPTSLLEQNV